MTGKNSTAPLGIKENYPFHNVTVEVTRLVNYFNEILNCTADTQIGLLAKRPLKSNEKFEIRKCQQLCY